MKRVGGVVLAAALVLPAAAGAQRKPSNTMHTNSAELYINQARKENRDAEKRELLQKALAKVQEGIAARPDNPKPYLLAGQIQLMLGNLASADSMLDKAEELYPEYRKETENDRMQAWIRGYNAGIMAVRDEKVDDAITLFEEAHTIYDGRPGALLNLAPLYSRKGNHDKAAAAYRQSLEILRNPPSTLPAEEQAQWKEFEEAASFNLATLYASTNRNDEAVAAYRDFLARHPGHALGLSNMAVVLTRMGKADEAAKVYHDLLGQNLEAEEYFGIGVGLFRANDYTTAAEAFRKAIAKNPYLRDAHYNLAQALYAHSSEVLEERGKVAAAQQKSFDEKLRPLYQELAETTEKLLAIDPASRNGHALLANAYRGLSDISAGAAATEFKNKTLTVLKSMDEGLPFEVTDIAASGEGEETLINGRVVNLKGTAGAPVKLKFTLVDAAGTSVGTGEIAINLPEVQGDAPFTVKIPARSAAGWKYEIIK